MKNAIVIGSDSDIAKGIEPLMLKDYEVITHWKRGMSMKTVIDCPRWDLCLIALGKVSPIGNWWELDMTEWTMCMDSNLLLPLKILKEIWPRRKNLTGSTVIWLAGSNPNTIMPGYSSYNTSKIAVLKLVEQLDAESPDTKFVALGTGIVNTKIHNATRAIGWANPRLDEALKTNAFTSMADIYKAVQWCVEQPKEVVGGRNLCVSDLTLGLEGHLKRSSSFFKLRRDENRLSIFKGIEA